MEKKDQQACRCERKFRGSYAEKEKEEEEGKKR